MTIENDTGQHYRKEYKGVKLDPARIATIYEISHPLQQAILKKSLVTGGRGQKDLEHDIKDIICACHRWLEMIEEDSE